MNDEAADQMAGTPLALFFQASAPGPAVAEAIRTTAQRLMQLYRMPLLGVANGARAIPALRRRIILPGAGNGARRGKPRAPRVDRPITATGGKIWR